MIILIIAPAFPATIEAMATMMPITDNIKVIVHAHRLPIHRP